MPAHTPLPNFDEVASLGQPERSAQRERERVGVRAEQRAAEAAAELESCRRELASEAEATKVGSATAVHGYEHHVCASVEGGCMA